MGSDSESLLILIPNFRGRALGLSPPSHDLSVVKVNKVEGCKSSSKQEELLCPQQFLCRWSDQRTRNPACAVHGDPVSIYSGKAGEESFIGENA